MHRGNTVTLDGSGSSDPDGDILTQEDEDTLVLFITVVDRSLSTYDFRTKAINVFSASSRALQITGLENEKAGVKLFDLSGRLLLKTTVSPAYEVKLPGSIKTGVYIIRINTLKGSLNKKIILR